MFTTNPIVLGMTEFASNCDKLNLYVFDEETDRIVLHGHGADNS